MILQNLAYCFTGHTIRSRVDDDPLGQCRVIQVKDLNSENTHIEYLPHRIALDEVPPKQLLRNGDILLLTKNNKNKAVKYDGQFPHAIAVSVFTIIRLTTNHVYPDFLVWYLNSKTTQDYFATNRVGTNTQNLPKQAIDLLDISVPPIEKQQAMIRLIQQQEKYKALQMEYENNVNLLMTTLFQKQLNQQA